MAAKIGEGLDFAVGGHGDVKPVAACAGFGAEHADRDEPREINQVRASAACTATMWILPALTAATSSALFRYSCETIFLPVVLASSACRPSQSTNCVSASASS